MQWSQIKTLFIICFLVLDVYLIFQFLEKREAADLSLFEPENATIEEKLEDENITIKQMPEAQPDETFLSVKQKIFSKSEQKQINKLSNQNVSIVDDKYIISQFKNRYNWMKVKAKKPYPTNCANRFSSWININTASGIKICT
ncbi:hypothetical protein P5G51_000840 [Virgibacillus sp. 179-BFC.A HS]|uniref:Uncharacterized protein n=1 Tax=Tigheibacillus jepli TaxID=3035914 RepID=A0ABU5CCU0_9BACI|nr:hypothetical protein [Virgibacillus sp. 179-BFC.A HS]MDY0404145.1 hypothetical protein [Virgibacillus sp. 179-BFC.A HS]